MSRKQEIYQEMLFWALPYIRNMQTMPWWKKALNKSCLYESELVHNLHVSILEEGFGEHDFHVLNYQAKSYLDISSYNVNSTYNAQKELIAELFSIVPKKLRHKLEWSGPKSKSASNTIQGIEGKTLTHELLVNMLSDGMNKYVNEALIPAKVVDQQLFSKSKKQILDKKYDVAYEVAGWYQSKLKLK